MVDLEDIMIYRSPDNELGKVWLIIMHREALQT